MVLCKPTTNDLSACYFPGEPITSDEIFKVLGKTKDQVDQELDAEALSRQLKKGLAACKNVVEATLQGYVKTFLTRYGQSRMENGGWPLPPSKKSKEHKRNVALVTKFLKNSSEYTGFCLIVYAEDIPEEKKPRLELEPASSIIDVEMATDYQQEAINFIRSFDAFGKEDYEKLVEALRHRRQNTTEAVTTSMSQLSTSETPASQAPSSQAAPSQASTSSEYLPAVGGRNYERVEDDVIAKARLVRGCVELNVSSRSMIAIAEMYGFPSVTDRTARIWIGATERLHSEHLLEVIRLDKPFGLGFDGSKLAMQKYEVVTVLVPGEQNFCMAMLPVATENVDIVMNAFTKLFDSLPADLQTTFAKNCKFLINDNAAVAKSIAKKVDAFLSTKYSLKREHLTCSMHSAMHLERTLEASLVDEASRCYVLMKGLLTTSRTHGYQGSLGNKFQLFLEGVKIKRGLDIPITPFQLEQNIRFGVFYRNAAVGCVTYDLIVEFLALEGKEKEAEIVKNAKPVYIPELVSVHLLWNHLCLFFWTETAKEATLDEYKKLIKTFQETVELVRDAACPALFLTSEGNPMTRNGDNGIPGFSQLLNSILDDESGAADLNERIRRKLDPLLATFSRFEQLPKEDIEGLVALTNVHAERCFSIAKDTFVSKFNSTKLASVFCCRINSTLSHFMDDEETLRRCFRGLYADEKRGSDVRKSAHAAAVSEMMETIDKEASLKARLQGLTELAVALDALPKDASKFDAAFQAFTKANAVVADFGVVTRDEAYDSFTSAIRLKMTDEQKETAANKVKEANKKRKQHKKSIFLAYHSVLFSE
ncbi:Oidioi.mRNA.OKI2018_I69.chr2.g6169.t1.cds [Oikopleura dioica]|uniref:Oidioi.mRNA.OKI2018_I69.chr2.g6169.t1.cds n=1 Tax=Oikopleura dioica TaxID=34765 RepID=A0ABN7T611_OIKDI|nr:Oidioi.mRNA.OKI2018_I69.chr2.g6169.t1.cds [Oikopleura dioica]